MQVLGDLISLPRNGQSLPLPWWHRAPLGLLHDTDVYVALVDSGRGVPDLVVSVLDLSRWDDLLMIQCRRKDEPGVASRVFTIVESLNVVLAETVTLETDNLHEATLICEVNPTEWVKEKLARIVRSLIDEKFRVTAAYRFETAKLVVLWHARAKVEEGWLHGIPYVSQIEKFCREAADKRAIERSDLTRVVVSADTEKRILRYVFPKKGVMTIKIRHADRPGAIREMSRAITDCDLNILSSLLRRGGQQRENAEFVAVCEPRVHVNASISAAITARVEKIDQKYRAVVSIQERGRPAHLSVDFRDYHAKTRRTRPLWIVDDYVPENLSAGNGTILARIEGLLTRLGFDAFSRWPKDPASASHGDSWDTARKRFAKACVVPVLHLGGEGAIANLAFTVGSMLALGTPTLVLGSESLPELSRLEVWCASNSVHFSRFRPEATSRDPGSAESRLTAWLSNFPYAEQAPPCEE